MRKSFSVSWLFDNDAGGKRKRWKTHVSGGNSGEAIPPAETSQTEEREGTPMIQIQGRQQFRNAADRMQKERMSVRRYEASAYEVTNTAKGHRYIVRFTRRDGSVFGQCTCEAGTPTTGRRVPMICKHLLAAVIFHNAVNAMRRAASAAPAPVVKWEDDDDPDCDWRNY